MFARNNGFTVLELLIAVLLASIVTSAAMSIYVTEHKQLLVQGQVSDMQSSIRAAIAELATKIRSAGYNLPEGIPPIEAYNTNPDTIVLIYDSGLIRDVTIEHAMPEPSAELRCDGHDLTGLYDGDWVYIFDPFLKTGEYFIVTQVQYSPPNIQHNTMSLNHSYPVGSKIMKIKRQKYYIDRSNPNRPNLMVQEGNNPPQLYAENITDLQFRYVLSSHAVVDTPLMPDMIREVMISVAARTDNPDPDFNGQYRGRTLATKVKVRNLGVN